MPEFPGRRPHDPGTTLRGADEQSAPAMRSDTVAALLKGFSTLGALLPVARALLAQASVHRQLAAVEWSEERRRLGQLALVSMAGFACLLCCLLFGGVLVLAASWDGGYRIPAIVGLLALYVLGLALAWRQMRRIVARGRNSFSATCAELEADLALLRSQL